MSLVLALFTASGNTQLWALFINSMQLKGGLHLQWEGPNEGATDPILTVSVLFPRECRITISLEKSLWGFRESRGSSLEVDKKGYPRLRSHTTVFSWSPCPVTHLVALSHACQGSCFTLQKLCLCSSLCSASPGFYYLLAAATVKDSFKFQTTTNSCLHITRKVRDAA